jgi:MOSC domain-containing protein YiiM
MGDPLFVKRFRHAERPGLYCRVLQEGSAQAGDAVTAEPYVDETVTIIEMFRDFYQKGQSEAELRRYLAAPIAVRSRVEKEEQLKALLAGK